LLNPHQEYIHTHSPKQLAEPIGHIASQIDPPTQNGIPATTDQNPKKFFGITNHPIWQDLCLALVAMKLIGGRWLSHERRDFVCCSSAEQEQIERKEDKKQSNKF
jgi:hypothetical protein